MTDFIKIDDSFFITVDSIIDGAKVNGKVIFRTGNYFENVKLKHKFYLT